MSKNNKTVQIPLETFLTLYRLLEGWEVSESEITALKRIISDKFDALIRREYYTTYKTAPTEEEREQARQKYLDSVGMNKDFRW